MKIYCTDANPAFTESQLKELNSLGEVVFIKLNNISEKDYINLVKDAEILIVSPDAISKLTSSVLSSLPNLKFISLATVGFNWIDLETLNILKIPVSNVKGANSESVAEHIWGMILNLSKRISEFDRDIRNVGAYEFPKYKGNEVFGKTLGLIGNGDIGSKVARIAKAFEMKIISLNQSNLSDLPLLLSQSDIINISIPLNDKTKNFISKKELNLMKNNAILINCAREEIVNKADLIEAIKNRRIGGYGVETAVMVPIAKNDDYLKYPNILVNAHNAFNSHEADEKTYGLIVENIKKFLADTPQNLINS